MNPSHRDEKTFTVVVGVDYSELCELALTDAIMTARTRPRSHVHVVHALELRQTAGPSAGAPYVPEDATVASASEELRKFVEHVLADPRDTLPDDGKPLVDRLTTHILRAPAAQAIAQLAADLQADLVVVGTHGRRGMARLLMGSVAEAVVRLAPCPVLVVRPVMVMPDSVPQIEPPCPKCLETRAETNGREFWCAQHRERHERRHTYHLRSAPTGRQSGFLIPLESPRAFRE